MLAEMSAILCGVQGPLSFNFSLLLFVYLSLFLGMEQRCTGLREEGPCGFDMTNKAVAILKSSLPPNLEMCLTI